MFRRIIEDKRNFNFDNDDEKKVLQAHYYSAYKRTLVIKVPFSTSGLSVGIIFLGARVKDKNLVKHEYGHRVQLKYLGIFRYLKKVFVPSVTTNIMNRLGYLPYDYYGSPWEAEADRLGQVIRKKPAVLWPEEAGKSFKDLMKML